jgi:hypothetical protein
LALEAKKKLLQIRKKDQYSFEEMDEILKQIQKIHSPTQEKEELIKFENETPTEEIPKEEEVKKEEEPIFVPFEINAKTKEAQKTEEAQKAEEEETATEKFRKYEFPR